MGEENFSSSVLLVISRGNHGTGAAKTSAEADGRKMGCEEWESLVAESYEVDEIRIHVDTQLLTERSAYFSSCLNFKGLLESESSCESLNVDSILPIFCSLLQYIHGCKPSLGPSMIGHLIQCAAYFCVDHIITDCENWVSSNMCNSTWRYEDDFPRDLSSIWLSATALELNSIVELCVKTLAINFAWAACRESFVALPLSLLEACIDHPELTIKCEMDLCIALLRWYENQDHGSPDEAVVEDPSIPLKKIQLNLLPIHFILSRLVGKHPLNIFNTTSTTLSQSDAVLIKSIIDLRWDLAFEPVKNYLNFKPVIRLTNYLKELDLSCCHQVTCHHLIAGAAQVSTLPKNRAPTVLLTGGQLLAWPCLPVLPNMKILNLSHCWRLEPQALLMWLQLVCPDLVELRAPHCGQLLHIILEITSSLSNLAVLDLSEREELTDIVGAVTRKRSSQERSCPRTQDFRTWDPRVHYDFSGSLRELSLRGRSEITDGLLLCLASSCLQLRTVDFSGCTGLSDLGLSRFLNVCKHHSIREFSAAGTKFGAISCGALAKSAKRLLRVLETLDLSKCSALGSKDLSSLLQALHSVVSLALAFTGVNDMALLTFVGTSLRHLNLRETKVSGGVLSQILARNSNLKDLNIRGCTQLRFDPFDYSLFPKTFEWENVEAGWEISDSSFSLLGFSSCKLQNLAIGVGGTISEHSLLCIAEKCPDLKRLSLSFQIIPGEGLIRAIRNLKSLQALELQNMTCTSRNLLNEIASSLPNLKILRLERVVPWLSDDDLLLFSQSCTGLQSLSLLGCQQLSNLSSTTMINAWRGLQDLRLEECQHLLTQASVRLLLRSFKALRVLHLRHIGKVLPENFILAASSSLPLLQKLAIDLCDAIDGKIEHPEQEMPTLKSLFMNRCKSVKDSFQGSRDLTTENTSYYNGRTHKDTIVLEWNSVIRKESVVSERLTFE